MREPHRPPFDAKGAGNYCGTTERHVRELVYRNEIPYIKVGRLVRFLPDDLDAWLAENRRGVKAS
jgi:excisionase family DNA binding protein